MSITTDEVLAELASRASRSNGRTIDEGSFEDEAIKAIGQLRAMCDEGMVRGLARAAAMLEQCGFAERAPSVDRSTGQLWDTEIANALAKARELKLTGPATSRLDAPSRAARPTEPPNGLAIADAAIESLALAPPYSTMTRPPGLESGAQLREHPFGCGYSARCFGREVHAHAERTIEALLTAIDAHRDPVAIEALARAVASLAGAPL